MLERLFDLPRGQRTLEQAAEMLEPQWQQLLEAEPEVAELFAEDASGEELAKWLAEAHQLLGKYFTLEDPNALEPAERELYVETALDSGLVLRGYVDRLDVAPTGEIRVVDYKTGRSPSEFFEAKALFQMKFYALVLWRLRGVVPAMLQLVYLGNGEIVRYVPDEADLLRLRAQGLGAVDGDHPGAASPATGGRAPARSATGATTRRSAPPGAAHHRRSRPARWRRSPPSPPGSTWSASTAEASHPPAEEPWVDSVRRMSVGDTAAVRAVGVWKRYGGGPDAGRRARRRERRLRARAGSPRSWGRRGPGKSTLLHCLAGLDQPTDGQVFLGDVDLTRLPEKQLTHLRRDRIGFVFQAFNLVPTLTALENITLPARPGRPQAGPGLARPP